MKANEKKVNDYEEAFLKSVKELKDAADNSSSVEMIISQG
jgi:hypothetical protein